MKYATKIRMIDGFEKSSNPKDISSIYLEGDRIDGLYAKDFVHDYLMLHPRSIQASLYPFRFLVPVMSPLGEKFVRSEADSSDQDNLLALPRI